MAINFHGGSNLIAYPWGSFGRAIKVGPRSYSSYFPPDQVTYDFMTQMMSDRATNVIYPNDPRYSAFKYRAGTINEMIFPQKGGFNDWVYGAAIE